MVPTRQAERVPLREWVPPIVRAAIRPFPPIPSAFLTSFPHLLTIANTLPPLVLVLPFFPEPTTLLHIPTVLNTLQANMNPVRLAIFSITQNNPLLASTEAGVHSVSYYSPAGTVPFSFEGEG